LLCGHDENYREKIRDYNKDNEGYLKYITIEESKNKIHVEDIAKFVLSPLLFIAGKEIEIPNNKLSDDKMKKAVLDRSEEILHKKLRSTRRKLVYKIIKLINYSHSEAISIAF
jgi:hypothetical protein